jgi:hypothetical protein
MPEYRHHVSLSRWMKDHRLLPGYRSWKRYRNFEASRGVGLCRQTSDSSAGRQLNLDDVTPSLPPVRSTAGPHESSNVTTNLARLLAEQVECLKWFQPARTARSIRVTCKTHRSELSANVGAHSRPRVPSVSRVEMEADPSDWRWRDRGQAFRK